MFVAPEGLAATRRDLLFYPSESEILIMDLHEGSIVTRLRGAGPTVAAVAAQRGERAVRNRVTSSTSPLLFSATGSANHPVQSPGAAPAEAAATAVASWAAGTRPARFTAVIWTGRFARGCRSSRGWTTRRPTRRRSVRRQKSERRWMMPFAVSWVAILEAGHHTLDTTRWTPHTLDTTHPHHSKAMPFPSVTFENENRRKKATHRPPPAEPKPLPAKTGLHRGSNRLSSGARHATPGTTEPKPPPHPAPNDIHPSALRHGGGGCAKDNLQRSAARARKRVNCFRSFGSLARIDRVFCTGRTGRREGIRPPTCSEGKLPKPASEREWSGLARGILLTD